MCQYLCCLVFKQADDYNVDDDDDDNDDKEGSGLRRSSCRGVERGADNQPVYSRKVHFGFSKCQLLNED